MTKITSRIGRPIVCSAIMLLLLLTADAQAGIIGETGTVFDFTAKQDYISTADGGSLLLWGYANANGSNRAQYPGPTLIINQGDTVTVNLSNELPVPVSIVFPGQTAVTTSGTGVPGLLTEEVPADGGATTVSYTFAATHAGTYHYHSGTEPDLQIEMGLVGAIIVRPYGFDPLTPTAYGHPSSAYDREFLFVLSEMVPEAHNAVAEILGPAWVRSQGYLSDYFPKYWFISGRTAPDTMFPAGTPWLPTQPYNCMPMMHPGEKLLMRVVNVGRDPHPYHHHGNHARIIAKDGRLLESTPGAGADLSHQVFTIQSVPGETVDAIFEWTGKGLGWDIYGHAPGDPLEPNEYAPDHGKPFPVTLPGPQEMAFGGFWSGSPFLGALGALPPGEGGLNPYGGYAYMWHSHTEKEMVNFDLFPGGMMTMLIIEAPGVDLMD